MMITDARRRKVKARTISLVLVVILVGLLALAVLGFGNPQWHKSIYIFQAYVCQKGHEGAIRPPAGYTGKWVIWWMNGQKWMEYEERNGKTDGTYVTWHPNGRKSFEGTYRDGEPVGVCMSWHDNGQKHVEKTWDHGEVNGLFTVWDRQGRVVRVARYVDGGIVENTQDSPNE